jgi:hypothetical protein
MFEVDMNPKILNEDRNFLYCCTVLQIGKRRSSANTAKVFTNVRLLFQASQMADAIGGLDVLSEDVLDRS